MIQFPFRYWISPCFPYFFPAPAAITVIFLHFICGLLTLYDMLVIGHHLKLGDFRT